MSKEDQTQGENPRIFLEPKIDTNGKPSDVVARLNKQSGRIYGNNNENVSPGSFSLLNESRGGKIKKSTEGELLEHSRTKSRSLEEVATESKKELSALWEYFEKIENLLQSKGGNSDFNEGEFTSITSTMESLKKDISLLEKKIGMLQTLGGGSTDNVSVDTVRGELEAHSLRKGLNKATSFSSVDRATSVGGEILKKMLTEKESTTPDVVLPIVEKEATPAPERVNEKKPTPFDAITKATTEPEHAPSNEQRLRVGMTVTLVNNETGSHEPWRIETIRKEERSGNSVWVGDIVNETTKEKRTQAMEGLEVFSQAKEREVKVIASTPPKPSILRPAPQATPEKKLNVIPVGEIISLFNKNESESEELLQAYIQWEKKWLENDALDRFREKNNTLSVSPQQIESTKKLLTAYKKIIEKSISGGVSSNVLAGIKQNVIILVRILSGVSGKDSEDITYNVKNYTEEGDRAWLSRLEGSLEKTEAPTPVTQQKQVESPIPPINTSDKRAEPQAEPKLGENSTTEHTQPDIYSTWPTSYLHQKKEGSRTIWVSSRNKGKVVELANPDAWSKEKDASKQVFSSYLNFIMNGTPEEQKTKITLFSDLIALKNQYISLLGNEKLDAAEVMREQFRRALEESQKKWNTVQEEKNIVPALEKKYNIINDEFTVQKNRCEEIKKALSSALEREMITKLLSRIEQENGKTYQKIKDGDITKEDENTLTQLHLLVQSFKERLDVLERKNHAIYGKASDAVRSSAVSPAKDNWIVKKRDGTETTVKEWREEQLSNEEKKVEDSHKSRIDSHLELLQRHRDMFKRDPETYKKLYENKLYVKGDFTQDIVNETLGRLDGGRSQDELRADKEAAEAKLHTTLTATKETFSPDENKKTGGEKRGNNFIDSLSQEDKKGDPKETTLNKSAFKEGMVNAENTERSIPHWTKNSQEKTQEEKEKKMTAVAKLLELLEKSRVKEWWAYAFVKSPKSNPFAQPETPQEQAPKSWRVQLEALNKGEEYLKIANELLTKNISDLIMKYVPSYVTKENPESLVSFLALDGHEVLHNDTEVFDRQFKKNQREEISYFIDALQKISVAINENEQGNIQKNVTILDYIEAVKKLAARADNEENK